MPPDARPWGTGHSRAYRRIRTARQWPYGRLGLAIRTTQRLATLLEGADVVEIRELQVCESDALIELFDAVLPEFEASLPAGRSGPQAFLQNPASFALGAYSDGTPAGLAWGLQMCSPSGRLTTYLHELDVREEWRRRGIATALVNEAMGLARRRGSTRFWLSTGGPNDVAQALYESLGGDRKPLGDVNYWWTLD